MTASNTKECFIECVGKTIKGILFSALPLNDRSLSAGTKTMVFNDGTGLTIASNGSYWPENAENIKYAIEARRKELNVTKSEIGQLLALAGE